MTTEIRRIERAITCVDDERSILQSEQQAFRKLREFLRSSQPVSMTHGGAPAARTIVQTRGSTTKFVDVYRDTVMGVDHYESHYGECLEENIAIEFGPEIATAIRANTELNPLLHQQLHVSINESLQRRSQLLETLDGERDSLRTAIENCRTLDRQLEGLADCRIDVIPFDELECHWDRLSDLEDRINKLMYSRQNFIMKRRTSRFDDNDHVSFNDYLYGTLESKFPVLKTGLKLLDQIDRRR